MANITINEISQNYTYNIGTNSFATVAMPITACWGPAFTADTADFDKLTNVTDDAIDSMLEGVVWRRFPATKAGLESFVSTFRGPASNYRIARDYSYQMAMTLLTSGYDVLVCRLCPGGPAQGSFTINTNTINIQAKYPGTFGNQLRVKLTRGTIPINKNGDLIWNLVVYVVDASGVQTAVENLSFVLDINNSTDNILHVSELESNFIDITITGLLNDGSSLKPTNSSIMLTGGSDKAPEIKGDTAVANMLASALAYAKLRYSAVGHADGCSYLAALSKRSSTNTDKITADMLRYNEWLYTSAFFVYDLLKDKLSYNPQRIISPGWDDQNIKWVSDLEFGQLKATDSITNISPLHIKLMEVAYHSRCGTAMLDIPKSEPRNHVYDDSSTPGYAQMLARYQAKNVEYDENSVLYHTYSALFAPWRKYTYVGTSKQNPAPPSFLALLIQRAMLLNQPIQYEWALPTNRQHNLKIGTPDYTVGKKLLDKWQSLEGVGVNVITEVPDLGTTLWGNSTLYEVPPATYQALANLSTRYLVNAVEDIAYRCGISITFQYNNEQAYNKFYAGVTPTLDSMKNVGAITDYYVRMAADINGLDQVNANTVIGKIYLVIEGVINDIVVDLIALPPGTDLNQYRS